MKINKSMTRNLLIFIILLIPSIISGTVFDELGTYERTAGNGLIYVKTYYYTSVLDTDWKDASSLCQASGKEFAYFDTLEEVNAVFGLIPQATPLTNIGGYWMFIDGTTPTSGSTDNWYWTKTGKKLSFTIPWATGSPSGGPENRLAIGRHSGASPLSFNDVLNVGYKSIFLCQTLEVVVDC